MQQDVAAADDGENVLFVGGLSKLRRDGGHEGRILQLRPVQVVAAPSAASARAAAPVR